MHTVGPHIALDRAITLRPAREDDARALWRLAELDSAAVPAPPLLVAEIDGRLSAALSLRDGSAIADPFVATADVVTLMHARVRSSGSGGWRPRWPTVGRSAPTARGAPALPS